VIPEQHPLYAWLVETRRDFHRHPEVGHREFRTTAKIKEVLTGLGARLQELPGLATGAVGILEGQPGDKTLGLRADIDALPVHEDEGRPGHSEVDGVMHACGHDVHVAALLGAASALAARRDELRGRYVFLFQPGEEALCGAKTMVDGGALSVMQDARLVGFHVTSEAPTGLVALRAGVSMSEAHSLRITLGGPGGHAAMLSVLGDVIGAAAELVRRLGEVAEGLAYEEARCVCSVGTLAAGTAVNVVPTSAQITGTLRTFTEAQRAEALERLRALCAEVAEQRGVEVELELPEHTPAVVNDPAMTDLVEAEARALLGTEAVVRMPPVGPSDDVSEFLAHLPGCYFFVGGGAADGSSGMHHSPAFFVEDESLRVGAGLLVRSALALGAP